MGTGRILLAIVLGLGLLGYGWTTLQSQDADVRNAVETEGTVQSTGVEFTGTTGGSGNPSGGHYEVVVRYNYSYEGQQYTSESVYPGEEKRFDAKENADAVADQYSAGEQTTVYVNSEEPNRAFLINEETDFQPLWIMGVGGVIAVIGLLSLGKAKVLDKSIA